MPIMAEGSGISKDKDIKTLKAPPDGRAKIGDVGVMPLSLGPQVSFILGDTFYMDVVGDVRLEYSFKDIPFFNDGEWIAWNGGIGARYIF